MAFKLPPLPFSLNDLKPHMSKQTLEFHHGKHHKKYVETLNKLIEDTTYEDLSLEEIILESCEKDKEIFNNAAQSWNHEFFWNCLSGATPHPSREVLEMIKLDFSSLQDFKFQFNEAAAKVFGSGWVWLVQNSQGKLSIVTTADAETPITQGLIPILACDVWEHSYYLDYQNERPKFLKNFWHIVNWDFVKKNLEKDSSEKKYPEFRDQDKAVRSSIHLN